MPAIPPEGVRIVFGLLAVLLVCMLWGLAVIGPLQEPLTELYFTQHEALPAEIEFLREYSFANNSTVRGVNSFSYGIVIERVVNGSIDVPASTQAYRYITRDGVRTYYYNTSALPPRGLPAVNQTLSTPIPIAVTVVNHEGTTQTYVIEVYAVVDGLEYLLASGEVSVPDEGAQELQTRVRIAEPFNRARIDVRLRDRPEEIHFWLRGVAP